MRWRCGHQPPSWEAAWALPRKRTDREMHGSLPAESASARPTFTIVERVRFRPCCFFSFLGIFNVLFIEDQIQQLSKLKGQCYSLGWNVLDVSRGHVCPLSFECVSVMLLRLSQWTLLVPQTC